MKPITQPKVYLISTPHINVYRMREYLESVSGESWLDDREIDDWGADAELLVEFAGRLCYRSWKPGLNKNVTKVRKDQGEYLLNILRSGHGSVLEHANFTFVLHNVSRVLTAELNRHRAGTAISEQSLRYVALDDLPFRLPPNLSERSQERMREAVEKLEDTISAIVADEIPGSAPFAVKKEKTSAIRRIAPMGLATEMVWSANVRALRHIIELRSAVGAEEEIRIFAKRLHEIMLEEAPLLFGDLTADEQGALVTEHHKV